MVSSSQIENAGYNRTSQYDFELYRPKGGVDCAFECRLVPLEEMNNLIQVIIGSMYHYFTLSEFIHIARIPHLMFLGV
jgi:hypothetical protein